MVELVKSVDHSGNFDDSSEQLESDLRLRKTGIKDQNILGLFLVYSCLKEQRLIDNQAVFNG